MTWLFVDTNLLINEEYKFDLYTDSNFEKAKLARKFNQFKKRSMFAQRHLNIQFNFLF